MNVRPEGRRERQKMSKEKYMAYIGSYSYTGNA